MNNNSQKPFSFEITHKSNKSRARVGKIHTPHGTIDTPNFVAVGTNGTIKGIDSKQLEQCNIQLIFCNTYHLMIQPGTNIVKNAGGLHTFMNRTMPIITDSGGFQVFSLMYGGVANELKSRGQKKNDNAVLKISEEGVLFRSYRDGQRILLTPETSIQAQKDLGADIIIPFDELPPYHMDPKKLKNSLDRTHRWEKRSLDAHLENKQNQAIYAVVHGGLDQKLRHKSCAYLSKLPFDGYAIGGSLGKTHKEMYELLDFTLPRIPEDKPNHLLGIGDLPSIDQGIKLGIDTFDSSHPTRCARHGLLFTKKGPVKILQAKNKTNYGPIEENCPCITCKNFSLSYLHHLFKANELTAYSLATIHNLNFMTKLMENYRNQILENKI